MGQFAMADFSTVQRAVMPGAPTLGVDRSPPGPPPAALLGVGIAGTFTIVGSMLLGSNPKVPVAVMLAGLGLGFGAVVGSAAIAMAQR